MFLFLSFFLGVGSDLPIGQRSGNMAADVGAPPAGHPCLYCAHQTHQKHCDRWGGGKQSLLTRPNLFLLAHN